MISRRDSLLADRVATHLRRASDKEVVLKVLKPGVEDIMTSDLSFIYLTMKVLQYLNPALQRASLVDIVGMTPGRRRCIHGSIAGRPCTLVTRLLCTGDLRDAMTDEIDFVKEADNIQNFQSYLCNAGLESICTAPYVYKQLSTQRFVV